ncbi:phosphoglycerate dehydrogenase [Roseomonas alkaliterrae]|uniref:D-3-phosphoglycerate dehydrogenase n=1 Tax=Neoroseomonas alkaliterrae TaxID=1452450 RepID=A0A840XNE0_9PROT|nr:phosphoglycerate dehydrogenase [Neoroseomonas alkaliterrae]MBB5690095.1 D-3-phosphoglycerate dehydrogenase [Neoroseomonas alkaliterrae]MBR0676203.1 phosphoglycerate dehydrogenase [Neoroseomonas alkaliterrae]
MTPARLSLPKDRIRILLLEGISDSAVERLADAGYASVRREAKALEGPALIKALKGVHLLGIRSRTQVTEEVLAAADRLIAIGCFCIGTNQVALGAAAARGIPVFNAPFSNTRSVAELTLGEIVMLMRGIFPKSNGAHRGEWDKSAANSWELRGKTLGIVGYGNIGSQLSVLAEAFGMRVIYWDHTGKLPHGNAQPMASLHALLAESDAVTLHVPETPETMNMIGQAEIRAMKKGAVLVNNARGTVVDLDALAAALREGHLLGAAVDVFPVEPSGKDERFVCPLQGLPNVILTPHIGGSTGEAQWRIGEEVSRKLIEYSDTGATFGAVNFPQVQLPARPTGARWTHVHRDAPGILSRINEAFAKRGLNISAQYYQTIGSVGYVVVDSDEAKREAESILAEFRALPGTIRARLIYERR